MNGLMRRLNTGLIGGQVAQKEASGDLTLWNELLAYAHLAADVDSDPGKPQLYGGFQNIGISWEEYFRRVYSDISFSMCSIHIALLFVANFNARVYKNSKDEIVVAFRSSTHLTHIGYKWFADWIACNAFTFDIYKSTDNGNRLKGRSNIENPIFNIAQTLAGRDKSPLIVPDQYHGAKLLAKCVKYVHRRESITLVGFSKGGGQASYAANESGHCKVVTFDGARNFFSILGNRKDQINIFVPGDSVGDPNGSAGTGMLPGKYIPLKSSKPGSSHSMSTIIDALEEKIKQVRG